MAKNETVLRIFVASTEEMRDEVAAIGEAVRELNQTLPQTSGIRLEMLTWRTSATPGIGSDPQAIINDQVGEGYDIFIGLLWVRFGTATPRAGSGTEEEFNRAHKRFQHDPASVRVMIYFKMSPPDLDQLDPLQFHAVQQFKSRLGEQGVLYWDFRSGDELGQYIRIHLTRQAHDWSKGWGYPDEKAVPRDADRSEPKVLTEEGLFDLAEIAEEAFGIGTEAILRIGALMEQIGARTQEKTSRLNDLKTLEQREQIKEAKHIFNMSAVDLVQFAKGISAETTILNESVTKGIGSFSAALSYAEFHDVDTLKQVTLNIRQFIGSLDSSGSMIRNLKQTISELPRFTTQFNRARRTALDALNEYDRFVAATAQLANDLVQTCEAVTQQK
jgi:hypothetical protein